jgi:CBS domain-containing protein
MTPVERIKEAYTEHHQSMFPVVTRDNRYLGYILVDDLSEHSTATTAGEVLRQVRGAGQPRLACAHGGDSYDDALVIMRTEGLPFIPVVDYGYVFVGTIDSTSGESPRKW